MLSRKQLSAFWRITQSSSLSELLDTALPLEMSVTIYQSLQFNLQKPSDYFVYHQLSYSKILHGTHIAVMDLKTNSDFYLIQR